MSSIFFEKELESKMEKLTMTKQEMFDKVWQHFIVEKNPRSVKQYSNRCQYRGSNGAKCAIGLFIPDELYDPQWDDGLVGVQSLPMGIQSLLNYNAHGDFLRSLQKCHDHAFDTETIEIYMRRLAKNFDLEVPA